MAIRYYSNLAPPTTLTAGINNITTTIQIDSAAGLPPFQPFTLALDPNTPTMELVEVTAAAGTTLTVTRAIDGTSASNHSAGAVVQHVSSARDFAESNTHINASTNVHGLTGGAAVVGTTQSQTLTNKTLTSPTINNGSATGVAISGGSLAGTITGSPTLSGNPVFSGTPSLTNVSGNPSFSGNVSVTGTTALTGTVTVNNAINTLGLLNGGLTAIKLSDTTRTSDALVNDPELTITIPNANAAYAVEAYLIVSGDPDNDINVSFTDIFGAAGGWTPINFPAGTGTNSGAVEIVESALGTARSFGLHSGGITRYGIHIKGYVRTLGTAGTLTVRWGTLVAGGDGASINTGSWLKAERFA